MTLAQSRSVVMRILCITQRTLLVVLALLLLIVLVAYFLFRGSLPKLDGDTALATLKAPVTLTRDERGTVQIAARDMNDAMRALGFVHAQERFFEMDLARRSAAGELSALLGSATVKVDQEKRVHRLRARMEAAWTSLPAAEKEVVTAYVSGVNAGLMALPARPWQYFLLRTDPQPWREVDSLLVVTEMYYMLQSRGIEERFNEIELRKRVGDRVFDWLKPTGGEWDAALDGSVIKPATMLSATELDTRNPALKVSALTGKLSDEPFVGSNNWAVGAGATADGSAILANDMHLGLGVPNIWFRTQLLVGDGTTTRRIVGVTLPGVPSVVVGSNGDVAWGFTNSYGQWFDWVAMPKADAAKLKTQHETIEVKGGDNVAMDVREAPWGPVLHSDKDNDYTLAWTLYREGAINFHAGDIATAKSIDDVIAVAQQGGVPHQNFVAADRAGHIAWTIMGRIQQRATPPGSPRGRLTPEADVPSQWLPATGYPLIKDPADSRLWTANSRQLGGAGGAIIGDGGFDLGARAKQIRDLLREKKQLSEKDLYDIQLNRESRFLQRWSTLAQGTARVKPGDKTTALAAQLKSWNGQADIDQTGHRIARAFRQRVLDQLWSAWLKAADKRPVDSAKKREAQFTADARIEYPAWQAISARPAHLLPAGFTDWDQFLAAQLEFVHDDLVKQEGSLANATWGKRNVARIGHPFSRFIPALSKYLDMPKTPLAGDNHMPRVAAPNFGSSERMVVAPGHEDRAIFTMPGGQSGHPLSPFYGAGHQDWLDGKPSPLLVGETRYTLQLHP